MNITRGRKEVFYSVSLLKDQGAGGTEGVEVPLPDGYFFSVVSILT